MRQLSERSKWEGRVKNSLARGRQSARRARVGKSKLIRAEEQLRQEEFDEWLICKASRQEQETHE